MTDAALRRRPLEDATNVARLALHLLVRSGQGERSTEVIEVLRGVAQRRRREPEGDVQKQEAESSDVAADAPHEAQRTWRIWSQADVEWQRPQPWP